MICYECTLKHLAQALILLGESEKYDYYKVLAYGHICEALRETPKLRDIIIHIKNRIFGDDSGDVVSDIENLIKDLYSEWIKIM
jgi:hypothetical protein